MNQLEGRLESIQAVDFLHRLCFSVGRQKLTVLTLEIDKNIETGAVYTLQIKSTNIAIAKGLGGHLSICNQLKAKVVSVTNGKLLSSVLLDIEGFLLESVVSLAAARAMGLQGNESVLALMKECEVTICQRV